MSERIAAPHVGAPDPEKRTSPILEETDERYAERAQQVGEVTVSHCNGVAYELGEFVCSGDELLHCRDGVWLRQDSCDPVNP